MHHNGTWLPEILLIFCLFTASYSQHRPGKIGEMCLFPCVPALQLFGYQKNIMFTVATSRAARRSSAGQVLDTNPLVLVVRGVLAGCKMKKVRLSIGQSEDTVSGLTSCATAFSPPRPTRPDHSLLVTILSVSFIRQKTSNLLFEHHIASIESSRSW